MGTDISGSGKVNVAGAGNDPGAANVTPVEVVLDGAGQVGTTVGVTSALGDDEHVMAPSEVRCAAVEVVPGSAPERVLPPNRSTVNPAAVAVGVSAKLSP